MGLGAIGAAIVGFLARFITESAIKWLAVRAFIYSLFVLVLPVILYNLFGRIVYEIGSYALSQISQGSDSIIIQLSGLSAWMAVHLKLPESLSVVLSAVSLRMALNMIPFIN